MAEEQEQIVNVDQAIHLVEQVINFLLEGKESPGTFALVLGLYHESASQVLGISALELSKLTGHLMGNPDFRAHLRKVAADRVKTPKLELVPDPPPEVA